MKEDKVNRSPLFYVGDKYKLIPEIKPLFPGKIRRFIEPFVGGASVTLNVDADSYLLNDIECYAHIPGGKILSSKKRLQL